MEGGRLSFEEVISLVEKLYPLREITGFLNSKNIYIPYLYYGRINSFGRVRPGICSMYKGWECLGCDEDLTKNRYNDWKPIWMWNVKTKEAMFEEAKGEWMSDFESLACSIYEAKKPSEERQGSFPALLRVFKDDFQLYLFIRDVRNMVLTSNDSQLERIGFYSALMVKILLLVGEGEISQFLYGCGAQYARHHLDCAFFGALAKYYTENRGDEDFFSFIVSDDSSPYGESGDEVSFHEMLRGGIGLERTPCYDVNASNEDRERESRKAWASAFNRRQESQKLYQINPKTLLLLRREESYSFVGALLGEEPWYLPPCYQDQQDSYDELLLSLLPEALPFYKSEVFCSLMEYLMERRGKTEVVFNLIEMAIYERKAHLSTSRAITRSLYGKDVFEVLLEQVQNKRERLQQEEDERTEEQVSRLCIGVRPDDDYL